jgi:hypothetical protein
MDLVYLPAIVPDTLANRWTHRPMSALDLRLKGTSAYHPYALTAFPMWRTQAWKWAPHEFVFGDSGGYSIATRNLSLDPCAVLRWQLRKCAVGPLLDTPPYKAQSPRFEECLRRTVAAIRVALPLYRLAREAGHRFRWWGVVHGRTRKELEQWWRAVTAVYRFTDDGEGWCFSPKPSGSISAIARCVAFASDHGITQLHIFGVSLPWIVEAVRCLCTTAGLEFVTFDSSTAIKAAIYGKVLRQMQQRRAGGEHGREVLLTCPCTSCRLLREDLDELPYLDRDKGYWTARRSFHNTLVIISRVMPRRGMTIS